MLEYNKISNPQQKHIKDKCLRCKCNLVFGLKSPLITNVNVVTIINSYYKMINV
jgi:hypothetical protein